MKKSLFKQCRGTFLIRSANDPLCYSNVYTDTIIAPFKWMAKIALKINNSYYPLIKIEKL
jgi:hypothetical protein